MYKIAITLRKKEDHMTFFMNATYYQLLAPYFDIELVVPRMSHHYEDIVKRNDVLLICGGDDIHPDNYQQELHPFTHLEDHLIETMDFQLLKQFSIVGKPIIGICRGIQVINVFLHGNLYQDIPSQYLTSIQHSHDEHNVTIQKDSLFSQYFPPSIKVNSSHHQNIKELGKGLTISAISEDGLIEGIEGQHILAVQWHPERMEQTHQQQFITMLIDFIRKEISN